ncbi:MAG: hypothetical protein K9I85_11995 [Saprospiraceae bacterium]|nr:hypothetical protein [Saprospiraceae bacterium]
MARTFKRYYFGGITNPNVTFAELIRDRRCLAFGAYAVSIVAVLYTLVYVFLILGGGQPFRPWLDIPLESYYRYNVFFCAPSMFLGWILAAGVVHTVSRLLTRTGRFERILGLFGFGISIASWTTGIHDVVTSVLGGIHVISQPDYEVALNTPTIWRTLLWIQMGAYLIAFEVLFTLAVKTVYRTNTRTSVLLGTVGFLAYQLFFLIFNR